MENLDTVVNNGAELLEKQYVERLQQEFPEDPREQIELSETNKSSIQEVLDQREAQTSEMSVTEIFKDESTAIAYCEKIIAICLLEDTNVKFEDAKSMMMMDFLFSQSETPSLQTYALRKAWDNMKQMV